jgi:3-oxoacyl-[acyl-carrier-protein] synthase-3
VRAADGEHGASRRQARIAQFAYHLPEGVLTNDDLAAIYPAWSSEKILAKTGVARRHVAARHETAADLAYAAACKLFQKGAVSAHDVDVLIFCCQTPDYFLPSSACVLHRRLGLRPGCGAFDIGLGCSGFVYCVSIAKGLVETAQADNVLILTADTYSKLINPLDKSVRTLFSDAGAATLVTAEVGDRPAITRCVMGTDGAGFDKLIVHTGGFRESKTEESARLAEDESGNARSRDDLFMDGADVMAFSLREVPPLVDRLLDESGLAQEQIDHFIFHQGSRFMLEALRRKLHIQPAKFVIDLEETGNTVSSTIPIACARLLASSPPGVSAPRTCMLIGFGVGYSWAGTIAEI